MFKSNSRFAALLEDKDDSEFQKVEKKKPQRNKEGDCNPNISEVIVFEKKREMKNDNMFKSDKSESNLFNGNRYTRFSDEELRLRRNPREKEERLILEFEKRENEKKLLETLHIDNFPELSNITTRKESSINNNSSFLNKLVLDSTDADGYDNDNYSTIQKAWKELEPGWSIISRDSSSNFSIMTKPVCNKKNYSTINSSDKEYAIDILYGLIKLHEKRTQAYIQEYGYDTWVNMFCYPNYEYNCLEKNGELSEDDSINCDDDYSDDYGYEYDDYI
jgi:hypothetical protein